MDFSQTSKHTGHSVSNAADAFCTPQGGYLRFTSMIYNQSYHYQVINSRNLTRTTIQLTSETRFPDTSTKGSRGEFSIIIRHPLSSHASSKHPIYSKSIADTALKCLIAKQHSGNTVSFLQPNGQCECVLKEAREYSTVQYHLIKP